MLASLNSYILLSSPVKNLELLFRSFDNVLIINSEYNVSSRKNLLEDAGIFSQRNSPATGELP